MTLEISIPVYEKIKPYIDARNMLYNPIVFQDENRKPVVQLNFRSEITKEEQKSIEDIVSWLDAANPSLFFQKQVKNLTRQGG